MSRTFADFDPDVIRYREAKADPARQARMRAREAAAKAAVQRVDEDAQRWNRHAQSGESHKRVTVKKPKKRRGAKR